ncbi:hypothetical protein [Emcibacter sp. SYSU 3D8]|uniref:hypothetical protein n=1 Tax=Emcibacter sp. SYSU 3D8 TaxID=3133969 RepID=UPI0031FEAF01
MRETIKTCGGAIPDGRNRYLARIKAGVDAPSLQGYGGTDPIHYVISPDLYPRHLTDSQRTMVAAVLADLKQGCPENSPIGEVIS